MSVWQLDFGYGAGLDIRNSLKSPVAELGIVATTFSSSSDNYILLFFSSGRSSGTPLPIVNKNIIKQLIEN